MTFSELSDAILRWTNRPDITSDIPLIIQLAEARMKNDRRLKRMIFAEFDVSTRDLALPADLDEIHRWMDDLGQPMSNVNESRITDPNAAPGRPHAFMIYQRPVVEPIEADQGLAARMFPVPDKLYTTTIGYWLRIPPLGPEGEAVSNWLSAEQPDVYLFASLVEAGGLLRLPTNDLQIWDAKYERAARDMYRATNRRLRGPNPHQALPSMVIGSDADLSLLDNTNRDFEGGPIG